MGDGVLCQFIRKRNTITLMVGAADGNYTHVLKVGDANNDKSHAYMYVHVYALVFASV